MKKEAVSLFGVILVIVISGCTFIVSDNEEILKVIEETPIEDVSNVPEENISEELAEPIKIILEPAVKETPKEKPVLQALPASFEDKFDGTSIDQDRYSTTITGAGTIAQNNEIVMTGKGDRTIIWNVLYTKGDVDLTKGFTASVKINMKKAAVTVGDDMVIIGIERREKVQAGGRPDKAGYCEVFIETRHGDEIRLRMENTLGQDNGEGVRVSKTSGILTLSYLPEKNLLRCSFDNKEVTLNQPQDTERFALALRTGMHEDIIRGRGEYSESGGTGEFETVFDDLEFKSAVG